MTQKEMIDKTGLTTEKLAEVLGVSIHTVYSWRSGKSTMSSKNREKVKQLVSILNRL